MSAWPPGGIAWLQVDRTGIALLAVIALLASGAMTLDDLGSDVDLPTIASLFAVMIISAQFAESGFIDPFAPITDNRRGTAALLALTVAIGGGLSAILATDMLVIAIVPLLIAERADRMEAGHTLAEYARAGAPIAVLPLGFAVFWLALTRTLPLLPQR